MEFAQPIQLRPGGKDGWKEIGASIGGEFRPVYECAESKIAHELTTAMNLVWQAITYGMPDPKLKRQFIRKYGQMRYTEGDIHEFTGAMITIGLLKPDFGNFMVH